MSEQDLLNKVQNLLDETFEEVFEAGSRRLDEVEMIGKKDPPPVHRGEKPARRAIPKAERQKTEKELLDLCNMMEKQLKNE